jgi:hypothetical protein
MTLSDRRMTCRRCGPVGGWASVCRHNDRQGFGAPPLAALRFRRVQFRRDRNPNSSH